MKKQRNHNPGRIGIPLGLLAGMYGVLASDLRGQPLEMWPRLLVPHIPAMVIATALVVAGFIWIHRMKQNENLDRERESPQHNPVA